MMLRLLKSKPFVTIVAFSAFLVLSVNYAISEPGGIVGQSKRGCTNSGCHHNASPSPETTVTLSTDAQSFAPGQAYDFRIVTKNETAREAGCDISVDGGGKLSLDGSKSGLWLLSGELTHTQPRQFTGDSVVWNFVYTTPATPGTYHIFAAGNAVNGNGTDDAGDLWDTTIYTVVVGTNGVNSPSIAPQLTLAPNPARDFANVKSANRIVRYTVLDARGAAVAHGTPDNSTFEINTSALATGFYWVNMQSADGTATTTRFVVQK